MADTLLSNDSSEADVPEAIFVRTAMHDFYVVFGSVGVLLNLIVIIDFSVAARLITGSTSTVRTLILNQSCIDMMACIGFIVHQFHGLTLTRGLLPKWSWLSNYHAASLYCQTVYSMTFGWAWMGASTFSLEILTLERFLSVVCSTWHLNHIANAPKWKVRLFCAFIWMVGMLVILPMNTFTYGWDPAINSCVYIGYSPAGNLANAGFLVAWYVVIPNTIILICYPMMFFKVNRSVQHHENAASAKKEHIRRRMLITCLLIGSAYMICLTPNILTYFFYVVGVVNLDNYWYPFSLVLAYVNTMCNPLIYAWKMPDFGKGLRRVRRRVVGSGEQEGGGGEV